MDSEQNKVLLFSQFYLPNQQPSLKEVVCKPRPILDYGAAKAYPITATKGCGISSGKHPVQ